MRRIRFVALGIVSFVVSIFGALLAPGTFLNRALSTALCTVFSFNSAVCTASLVQSSNRVVAATPPAVERSIADISGYLQAQRDPSEFGDEPSAPSPGSNPQAPPFPQDPGPNFPVRPEFDDSVPNPNFDVSDNPTGTINFITDDNCQQVFEIKSNNGKPYLDSAIFTTSTSEQGCNNTLPPIYAKYATNGDEFTLSGDSLSPITVQIMNNGNILRISYKDISGNVQMENIDLSSKIYAPNSFQISLNKNNQRTVAFKPMTPPGFIRNCEERKNHCKQLKAYEEQEKREISQIIKEIKKIGNEAVKQAKLLFNQFVPGDVQNLVNVAENIRIMLDKQSSLIDKLGAYGRLGLGTAKIYKSTIEFLKKITVADVIKFGRLSSTSFQVVAEFTASLPSLLTTSILLGYMGWRFNNSYECFLEFGEIGGIPADIVRRRYGNDIALNEAAAQNQKKGEEKCKARCGQQQVSGGQTGDRRTIKLTANKGQISVSYDMKPVPDRLQVIYEGRIILDTGFVSGTGTRSAEFEGNSDEVEVIVTGNPSVNTTKWDYILSCPQ